MNEAAAVQPPSLRQMMVVLERPKEQPYKNWRAYFDRTFGVVTTGEQDLAVLKDDGIDPEKDRLKLEDAMEYWSWAAITGRR
jgi:hypothetical protein